MPKRTPGESLNEFLGKFMKSKHDKKKWPKRKQRLAVGFAEAREGARRG
jgi:hypothetical protein